MRIRTILITSTLLLIPALASATTMGLPGLPVDTSTDLSIKLLNMILGNNWYSWISGTSSTGPGSALAAMLKIYNNLILSVVALIIVYTYGTGIADTAHKGQVMGDKYSTLWTPIRQAGSIAALIPIPGLGGISLVQGLVAWLIMASIGLANAVWDGGLNYMVNNGGGMSPPTASFYNLPSNVIVGLADMGAETAALQETPAQGGPGLKAGPFTCKVIGVNDKKVECGVSSFTDAGNVMKGSLGSITATCIDSSQQGQVVNTCSAEASAVTSAFMSVYSEVGPVAVNRGAGSLNAFASNIGTLKTAFSTSMNSSVQKAFSHISTSATAGLKNFTTTAKADGWASAGMFFYELGHYNNAYQKATEVSISYTPGGGPLISAIPGSVVGIENAIAQDVSHSPDSESALIAASSQSATAGTATGTHKSSILTKIGETIDNAIGSGLKDAINYIISPPGAGAGNSINPVDPIVQLQAFGDKIAWTADSIMTVYAGAYVASAMTKNAGKSLIGQLSNVFDGGGTQVVATVAAGATKLFSFFAMPVTLLVILLAIIGFELAFYLPVAPAILFGFAVVEWLIAVIETLLAAPLWMAAHAMPTGDGLTGDHGKRGYAFLLALLVRPVLTIFGLFVALSIMSTVVYFMALSFNVAFESANGTGFNGPYNVIMQLVLLAGVMLVTVNKSIQVITRLPSTVLEWIGGEGGQPAGREELAMVGGYYKGGGNNVKNVITGGGAGKGGTGGQGQGVLTKLKTDADGSEGAGSTDGASEE